MTVGVVGSRKYDDLERVKRYVRWLVYQGHGIISGGADGVDTAATDQARDLGQTPMVFLPNYERHGRKATFERNKTIVRFADWIAAFWDGTSPGTLHTITTAAKAGKTVIINPPEPAASEVPPPRLEAVHGEQ